MNITLDGFMAGRNEELDWHFRFWNEEMARVALRQLGSADTLLLGRKTYQAMAAYWPVQALNPGYPREDIAYAEMMNRCGKIVFSTSLRRVSWCNTVLVNSHIRSTVLALKRRRGRDILVYGSGSIAALLMRLGLVDEYQLWVHPVWLGQGRSFPEKAGCRRQMECTGRQEFSSGVVLFFYRDAGPG